MINVEKVVTQAFPGSIIDIEAEGNNHKATLYFPFKTDIMLEYSFNFNGQAKSFSDEFKEYALRMFNIIDCADAIERQNPGKYDREDLLNDVADVYSKIENAALALDKALKIEFETKNYNASLSEQIAEAKNESVSQNTVSKSVSHKIDR